MINLKKGVIASKYIILVVIGVLCVCVYYFYVTDIKPQATSHFSVTGYVSYVSPAGYNFIIISSSTNSIANGTLPDMTGFPSATDPDYQYIGDLGYKGTLPNVGDKISVAGNVDNNVETNPPDTFAATATNITVLSDAQFNATIEGLIQAVQ